MIQLLALAALGAEIVEVAVEAPHHAARDHLTVELRGWEGDAELAWRVEEGRWHPLGSVTAPHRVRLPRRATVRVQTPGTVQELRTPGIWTPADLAGWSGPGLRGAQVTDLHQTEGGLFVTSTAGLGLYADGRWTSWSRRQGLTSDVLFAVDAGTSTWVTGPSGTYRLQDDRLVRVSDRPADDVLEDDEDAWLVERGRLAHTARATSSATGCTALLALPRMGQFAACDPPVALPGGQPSPVLPEGLSVTSVVPREAGGQWIGTLDAGLVLATHGGAPTWWRPTGGDVFGLARVSDHMLVAAGEDGAWRLTTDGMIPFGPPEGVRGNEAWAAAPSPGGAAAWLGTELGVSEVLADGHATPLPLAPLPAGVPTVAVVPVRRGAAVASEIGLVWLAPGPPAGWSTLVAAVGPLPRDLVRAADGSWWALGSEAAFRLEAGALTRWQVPGDPIGLAVVGRGVAVTTTLGLHTWVPGASMWSPLALLLDITAASGAPDGSVWLIADGVLVRWGAGELQRFDLPAATDVVADPGGAWVATVDGLVRAPATSDDTELVLASEPLAAVGQGAAGLFVVTEEGTVRSADGTRTWELASAADTGSIRRVAVDGDGLWIATGGGAFRVTP